MGRLNKGILGGFSGLVGTVVGSSWRGIEYIRSRPPARNSSRTPAQELQRARFAAAIGFLGSMKDLLEITYQASASRMTGTNSAVAHILKNAVSGVYPDIRVNYNLVQVSRGNLPNVTTPTAVANAAGAVQFEWTDNSGMGSARPTDKAVLVAYCEELNQCIYTIGETFRNTGEGVLPLAMFRGKQVQTWLAFIGANGKDIAPSVFTGALLIT